MDAAKDAGQAASDTSRAGAERSGGAKPTGAAETHAPAPNAPQFTREEDLHARPSVVPADARTGGDAPAVRFRDVHAAAMEVIAARTAEWGLLPVTAEEARKSPASSSASTAVPGPRSSTTPASSSASTRRTRSAGGPEARASESPSNHPSTSRACSRVSSEI